MSDDLRTSTLRFLAGLDGPLFVAFSGGRDSTALLVLASEARSDVIALHVNHHWRASAHEDARRARGSAQRLGVQFETLHVHAAESGAPEAIARRARYDALAERARSSAGTILTAHHATDRLENLLMGLSLGGSLESAFGPREQIEWDGVKVVRPLLRWTPDELESVCAPHDLAVAHDPTNSDLRHPRNRLRRVAGPALSVALGQRWSSTLHRWGQEVAAVATVTQALCDSVFESTSAGATFDRRGLERLPVPWRRRVIRQGVARMTSTRGAGPFIEMLCDACESREHREILGPGALRAVLSGGTVELLNFGECGEVGAATFASVSALIDGQPVALDGWRIRIRETSDAPRPVAGEPRWIFDASELSASLLVRQVREEDVFIPFGRSKQVRCIDQLARDGWDFLRRTRAIVIVDGDHVLGVVGGRRGNRALAGDDSKLYAEISFWPVALDERS